MAPRRFDIRFPGGNRIEVAAGEHVIKTDVPESRNEKPEYPDSFTTFLSSLASCTGFYVLTFLKKRDLDQTGLEISMKTHRNDELRLIDKVTFEIKYPDNLPEKYKEPLLKAAKFCAITRHLENPPEIEINAS